MFKKLKDRLEEEFKPLRLPTSVQQIAQAISPSASTNSFESKNADTPPNPVSEPLSASSEFFSICDDPDILDTSHTSNMQSVDLTVNSSSIVPSRSRRDSLSSVASDVSSLYPIYESSLNLNQSSFQSEWESEMDETTTSQLEKVTKEQLYQGYKKLLHRYNKYKGRSSDLSRLHKNVLSENMKLKNVLQENQDKSLRRIAELREQCQLGEKAKAHLEESLRNDLEERDHIITTLNTKIQLLTSGAKQKNSLLIVNNEDGASADEMVATVQAKNSELAAEVERLKMQLEMPTQLLVPNGPSHLPGQEHVKETITQLKSGIVRMKSENENISHLLSSSPPADTSTSLIDFTSSPDQNQSDEKDLKIEKLNKLLTKCKDRISTLNDSVKNKEIELTKMDEENAAVGRESSARKELIDQLNEEIVALKRSENDSAQTLAENKMAIHQEVEKWEQQVNVLTEQLHESRAIEKEVKSKAAEKLAHYEEEVSKLRDAVAKATQVNDEIMNKLRDQLARPVESAIDATVLEKETRRLDEQIRSFTERHQAKLNQALAQVENKLATAESNLARMCADRLIQQNATEVELQQNLILLDAKHKDATTRIENLTAEVKNLQLTIESKDFELVERSTQLENLNADLNERIDRMVVLGAELEEAKGKLELADDIDANLQVLSKAKLEAEEEILLLQKQLSGLQVTMNEVAKENSDHKATIMAMEKSSEDREKVLAESANQLKESLEKNMHLEEQINKLSKEKDACQKSLDKRIQEIDDLARKLEAAEESRNLLNSSYDGNMKEVSALSDDLKKLNSCLEEANAAKTALEQTLNNKTAEYESRLAKHEGELIVYKNLVHEKENIASSLSKELEKTHTELQELARQKTVLENEVGSLSLSLEKEKSSYAELCIDLAAAKDVLQKNQRVISNLEDEVKRGQTECAQFAESKKVFEYKIQKASNELESAKQLSEEEMGSIRKELQIAIADVDDRQQKLSTVELELQRCQDIVLEQKEVIAAATNSQEASATEITKLREALTLKESELVAVKANLERSESNQATVTEQQLQKVQSSLSETELLLKSEREKYVKILNEREEVVNKMNELENKLASSIEEHNMLNISNADMKEKIINLERSNQMLELKIRENEETFLQYKTNHEKVIKETLQMLAKSNEDLLEKEGQIEKLKLEAENISTQLQAKIGSLEKSLYDSELANQKLAQICDNRVLEERETTQNEIKNLVEELNSARNELSHMKDEQESEFSKINQENESRLSCLKNEIKFLNEKFEQDLRNVEVDREREIMEWKEKLDHAKETGEELLRKLEIVTAERETIGAEHADKVMKVAELEACLTNLKMDLDRNFNDASTISASRFEELYEERLQKIVADYEVQISRRDEKIEQMELELSESSDTTEELKALRLDLKNLQLELKEKDDALESRTEELHALKKESENRLINAQIDTSDIIENQRLQFDEEKKKLKSYFEERLVQETANVVNRLNSETSEKERAWANERTLFEEKLKAAQSSWDSERKSPSDLVTIPLNDEDTVQEIKDLECTSALAVAAIGSSSDSMEMLRQEIMKQADEMKQLKRQHKREVMELSKLAAMRASRSNDREREGDDVEHEYLRNILYEYMMGREQTVLAKVLAAIVKFDRRQMQNIIDHQTATNSLRIL